VLDLDEVRYTKHLTSQFATPSNKSPFDELDHLMHCVGALSSGEL